MIKTQSWLFVWIFNTAKNPDLEDRKSPKYPKDKKNRKKNTGDKTSEITKNLKFRGFPGNPENIPDRGFIGDFKIPFSIPVIAGFPGFYSQDFSVFANPDLDPRDLRDFSI